MPVRSTKGAANDFPAGSVAASGNNNGGIAIGVNHDHVQDAGTRNMSSGVPIVDFADKFDDVTGSKVVTNDGTGAATTDRAGLQSVRGSGGGGTGTVGFNPDKNGTRSEIFIIRGVTTKLNNAAMKTEAGPVLNGNFNNGTVKDGIHGTIIGGSGAFANPNNTYNKLARPSTDITPNFTHSSASANVDTGLKYTMVNPADGSVAVESEIFPSLAVPGELTYHFGHANGPITDEYKAKNAFEAADDTSS